MHAHVKVKIEIKNLDLKLDQFSVLIAVHKRMGKHLWKKHVDDDRAHDKQPGCIWGLVHALGYNKWQSNIRERIPHRKYEGQTHLKRDWNPKTKVHSHDDHDEERLLDEKGSTTPYHATKKPRKKRSLRARIKEFIAEDISDDSGNTQSKRGPSLHRTYSIHHLESLNDDKIYTNGKHPIILLPAKVDDSRNEEASKQGTDVLEIFKVDKQLLLKHLQDANEGVANFTRSALGLDETAKFSKSRSFPVSDFSQGKKLKPIKLENKQKEDVWSFPKEEKVPIVNRKAEKNDIRNPTSSSLKESLEKYSRLFENSFGTNPKLNASKSLKLPNEYGPNPASIYVRKMRSLSNIDSYCFSLNFEVLDEDNEGGKSLSNEEAVEGGNATEIKENDANLRLDMSDNDFGKVDCTKEEAGIAVKESEQNGMILGPVFISEEMESREVGCWISQGLEPKLGVDELDSINSNDPKYQITDETSDKIIKYFKGDKCPTENNCDMHYVRHLLNQSGIMNDLFQITWDASDQLLGPHIFDEVEAFWPHDQDQLTGLPDFYGCWHHQMLFDLVNEVLLEVYDVSLPYYPKSLSSSCNVRPFPWGNRIIDEVTSNIDTLMGMKLEEKQSLESIEARDLARDRRWMNLQFDSECIVLGLEEVIFDEILEEIIYT